MTHGSSGLERAVAALDEVPTPLEAPAELAARRARIVQQLQALNRDLPRRRRRRVLFALCAAAACAALGLGLVRPGWVARSPVSPDAGAVARETMDIRVLSGSARRISADVADTLASGSSSPMLGPGVLETLPGARARVVGTGGLEVEVAPESRLTLPGATPKGRVRELRLAQGSVRCSVDPAGAGEKLWVVTPDAKVVVKGTVFTVEVTRNGAGLARTCVRVERGKVAVSREGATAEVVAGASSGCEAPAPAPVPSSASSSPLVTPPAGEGAAPARTSLQQETELLAAALAAERRGDLRGAEARLVELLDEHPTSPLRPHARRALQRIRSTHAP